MSWTDKINTVWQGDCLELMKEMPDKCVDLVLTDPPYGVTQNEWDNVPDLKKMWQEFYRISKENTAFIIFSQQPFTSQLLLSNQKHFRYDLIWYKHLSSGFLNANRMPLRNHENLLVFYRALPVYNPIMRIGIMRQKGRKTIETSKNYGHYDPIQKINNIYYPQSVIDVSNANRTSKEHPTQKPAELIAYLVKTFSNEDALVFDPFMGSWTTAVACQQLGRRWIGVELSEEYCEIGRQRLRQQILI